MCGCGNVSCVRLIMVDLGVGGDGGEVGCGMGNMVVCGLLVVVMVYCFYSLVFYLYW